MSLHWSLSITWATSSPHRSLVPVNTRSISMRATLIWKSISTFRFRIIPAVNFYPLEARRNVHATWKKVLSMTLKSIDKFSSIGFFVQAIRHGGFDIDKTLLCWVARHPGLCRRMPSVHRMSPHLYLNGISLVEQITRAWSSHCSRETFPLKLKALLNICRIISCATPIMSIMLLIQQRDEAISNSSSLKSIHLEQRCLISSSLSVNHVSKD